MSSFTVSGLYEGLFVMRDSETGSDWLHYTGECIRGPRAGRQLEQLPTSTTTLGAFRAAWPQGTVPPKTNAWWRRLMGRFETGHGNFFLPKMFRRTLGQPDGRLPESTLGLGVVVGRRNLVAGTQAAARFFPMKQVRAAKVVNDRLGQTGLVVFSDPDGAAPVAFLSGGRTFEAVEGGGFRGSDGQVFDLAGRSRDGKERLAQPMAIFGRWYGFVATYPGASIWGLAPP